MAKKDINIKISADGKQAEKEIKSVKNTLNTLSNVGNIVTGLKSGIGIVKEAFDKVKATLFELNELYNVQSDAETRLEVAAKNNPYLDKNSVEALKSFASELQGIGEIGDETLLPMMANLAASGRTQEQIQNIMRAALEASATGMISMESAVQSLNQSLDGSVGSLGKLLPGLKNLTKEELESGKAIEEVQKAYNGMSEATANPLVQLANAWGDLKEVIGGAVNAVVIPIANILKTVVEGLTNASQKLKDFWNSWKLFKNDISENNIGTNIGDLISTSEVDEAKKKFDQLKEAIASTKAQIYELENASKEESETLKRQAQENLRAVEEYVNSLSENDKEAYRQYRELTDEIENSKNKVNELTQTVKEHNEELKELQNLNKSSFDRTRADRIKELKSEIASETAEIKKQERQIKRNQNTMVLYTNWIKQTEEYRKTSLTQLGATGGTTAQLEAQKQLLQTYSEQADEAERTYDNLKKQYDLQEKTKKTRTYTPTEDDKKVEGALKAYRETVKTKEREIEARKQLGEVITEETEAQELLNVKMSAYQTFWQTTGTLGKTIAQTLRDDIKKTSDQMLKTMKTLDDNVDDYFKKFDEAESLIKKFEKSTVEDQEILLKSQMDFLQKYLEMGDATEDQAKRIKDVITQIANEIDKLKMTAISEKIEQFSSVYSNISKSINELSNLAIEKAQNEATIEQAKLDEQLEAGILSYEEYEKRKDEIDKSARKKQYEAQMWQWSANLLEIGTNTALAITKALAEGGAILGPVLATSIGILGAAQLTTAIANKPIPPSFSFATGGIVQGSSYYGDKVKANVNSGEMILTQNQQRELWNLANGRSSGGFNVSIKNYIGEVANVSTRMDNENLEVMIKGIVNSGLNDGTFDNGILSAQNRQNGISYM